MGRFSNVYKSIQNPIENLENLKKLIEIYSECEKNNSWNYSFYSKFMSLMSVNKKYKNGEHYKQHSDKLWSMLFNKWKDNMLNMTAYKYQELYKNKGNYTDDDFKLLRDYLREIKDVSTQEEVRKIKRQISTNEELYKAFQKYTFEIDQLGWDYIYSDSLGEKKNGSTTHRLYINIESMGQYEILIYLFEKFNERNLPYCLKYCSYNSRDDSIVIYSDNENLLNYIDILREIIKEHPKLMETLCNPPILTGKIDNWIGYGSEPTTTLNGEQQSFNTLRAEVIKNGISKATQQWVLHNKDNQVTYQHNGKEENMKFSEYFSWEIVNSMIKELIKKSDHFNDSDYNIGDLEDEQVKKYLFNNVSEKFDTYIQDICNGEDINEEIIRMKFRDGKKATFSRGYIIKLMNILAGQIVQYDSYFVGSVRDEIKKQAKEYGIDENNFCFDNETVKQMKKYDEYKEKDASQCLQEEIDER